MNVTTIKVAASVLTASREERTISGMLLPFGELGSTSAGRVTAKAGCLTIPENVGDVILNIEHDDMRPIGRASSIEETDSGYVATFRIAETTAGTDVLIEASEGLRTGLSFEVASAVIRDGELLGGDLVGAGAVRHPAFPSAQIVASDCGDIATAMAVERVEDSSSTTTYIHDDGASETTTTTVHVEQVTTVQEPGETEAPDPDEEDDTTSDGEAPSDDPEASAGTDSGDAPGKEEAMNEATLAAAAATVPAGTKAVASKPKQVGLQDAIRMLASAYLEGGDARVTAALADITPGVGNAIASPAQWVGELWSGRGYQRRIVPLINHAELTSFKVSGWRWTTKPVVAPYGGNKADVPSNAAAVAMVDLAAKRLAGAHDIDRVYRDFPNPEFWNSYFAAMTESYARQSDAAALTDLLAGATPVAGGATPAGTPRGLVGIVDGAISLIDYAVPSFAIVNSALWRDILLTPRDKTLEYLNASLGYENGEMENFKIIPSAGVAANKVLVGARDAATFHELGGGAPIRVEAENIAKGGIDEGVFGYYATNIHSAAGLALVTTVAPV